MTTDNVPLRRSGRNRTGSLQTQNSPSTSEYQGSERSAIDDNLPLPEPEHVIKQEKWGRSSRGRKVKKSNYKESGSEDDIHGGFDPPEDLPVNGKAEPDMNDDADDDDEQPRRTMRSRRSRITGTRQPTRSIPSAGGPPRHMTRAKSRALTKSDEGYVDYPSEDSDDADGSLEDAPHTSSDLEADVDAEGEPDFDAEGPPCLEVQDDGRPYSLRQRAKINYAIPPPIEETKPPPKNRLPHRSGARTRRGPGWSATGTELSRWMGMPVDDSVRDVICYAVV